MGTVPSLGYVAKDTGSVTTCHLVGLLTLELRGGQPLPLTLVGPLAKLNRFNEICVYSYIYIYEHLCVSQQQCLETSPLLWKMGSEPDQWSKYVGFP